MSLLLGTGYSLGEVLGLIDAGVESDGSSSVSQEFRIDLTIIS
jgi:hypothetical protein